MFPTFQGRAFCSATCGTSGCPRRLTAAIEAAADRARLPVCSADLSPTCPTWSEDRPNPQSSAA